MSAATPSLWQRARAVASGALALLLLSLALGLVAIHRAAEPLQLLVAWRIDPSIPVVTPQRAHELYDTGETVFVDARTRPEYEKEHIPFSYTLPAAVAEEGVPDLDNLLSHAKAIVVYCDGPTCGASYRVAQEMVRNGYTGVHVLTDGLPGWKGAGFPVEGGAP